MARRRARAVVVRSQEHAQRYGVSPTYLAIGVATRCDDCIAFHVKSALQQGATREEIMETLAMSIYMGSGPSVMYASHAIDAYTGFTQTETPSTP